jgi:hypothetical protein
MSARSTLARFLIAFTACLLFCTIVSAEVPELMSLTDNASNDFTIHKTAKWEVAQAVNAIAPTPVLLRVASFESLAHASAPAGTETPSSPLFLLNSVLRT